MSTSDSSSSTVSTKDTNNMNLKLNELTKQAINQINVSKHSLQKLRQWIVKKISKGPRKEISHDWHVVHSFLERAIEHFELQEKHEDNKIRTLAKIKAYLELAKTERDFAQAWTYVNLADSLLPLVVDDKELGACIVRLRSRDKLIPDDMRKSLPGDMKKFLEETEVLESSNRTSNNTIIKDKYDVLREQEVRALLWNSLNRKVSLRMSLWYSVGAYLFVALLLALFVAESLHYQSDKKNALVSLPFLAISVLGLFGGGISAFLKARKKVVDITSYETIKVHTILRMLLGAAGSFVVFVAVNWLCSENMVELLNSDIYVFLGVGIAAGFSEKLFVGTLEQMANKLDIIGRTDEDNQSSKQ
ncbi:MAG: hypothetical protein ACYS0C_02315 [Planctomycetota bacterium]|jgi:hypothetical protein